MRWNRSRWAPIVWATAALMGSAWLTATTTWRPGARRRGDRWSSRCAAASRRTTRRRGSGTRSGGSAPSSTPAACMSAFSSAPVQSPKSASSRPRSVRTRWPSGLGDRRRRLLGALERRGVDGRDPIAERGDALGHGLGLLAPVVGQVQALGSPGQHGAGRRRLPVAHEQHERRRGGGFVGVRAMRPRNLPLRPWPPHSAVARSVTAEVVRLPRLPAPGGVAGGRSRPRRSPASATGTTGAGPCPGFGDPRRHLLIVGLAPAAHGGNRTGRVFTGDRSGDFLFAALHRDRLRQPADVGSRRRRPRAAPACYITAAVKCAPPANKPTPAERETCRPYLERELGAAADGVRVLIALGQFGWDVVCSSLGVRPRPRFGHGAEAPLPGGAGAPRQLPREPAEHLHRQAHRAHARRRVRTSAPAQLVRARNSPTA